jgi:hypothetical protein
MNDFYAFKNDLLICDLPRVFAGTPVVLSAFYSIDFYPNADSGSMPSGTTVLQ